MLDHAIRYSLSFKLEVVRAIEKGRFASVQEACRFYGINGHGTVPRWIDKYGRAKLQRKFIHVETPDERTEIAKLKAEITELKKVVLENRARELINQAHFDIVCEEAGIKDSAAHKKKSQYSCKKSTPGRKRLRIDHRASHSRTLPPCPNGCT